MKKYLVGGAVRDDLLLLPVKEQDWVVVGSTSEEMIANGYQQVGKEFPVFIHPKSKEQYALARTEKKIGKGYTGFSCNTSSKITLEEDLYRRDITINAIAKDEKGNLIDPYNGIEDIKLRRLRHISSAFQEDQLRVLRVARFAAKFFHLNFTIAKETLSLMKQMNNELIFLSPERIWKETERALKTKNPEIYFHILHCCGALEKIFPEINSLFGIPSLVKSNHTIDTGIHTLITLAESAKLSSDISIRFSALCHDIGKSLTDKLLWPKHFGHCKIGIKLIEKMCKRLKIPNKICYLAKIASRYHDKINFIDRFTPNMIINFFNNIDIWRNPKILDKLIIISHANIIRRKEFLNCFYLKENFLRKAYKIVKLVSVEKIIKDGFKKNDITKELNKRRKEKLKKWKESKIIE